MTNTLTQTSVRPAMDQTRRNLLLVFVIGSIAGFLAGISVSSVAATIVGAVVGAGGVVVAALAGLSVEIELQGAKVKTRRRRVDPLPLTVFAAGIAIFALVGVMVRTANWLDLSSPPPKEDATALNARLQEELGVWVGLGTNKDEVLHAMLAAKYPSATTLIATSAPKTSKDGTGLDSAESTYCETIRTTPKESIKQALSLGAADDYPLLKKTAAAPGLTDDDLKDLVTRLC